jgi:uncharacterized integral membrane protein
MNEAVGILAIIAITLFGVCILLAVCADRLIEIRDELRKK